MAEIFAEDFDSISEWTATGTNSQVAGRYTAYGWSCTGARATNNLQYTIAAGDQASTITAGFNWKSPALSNILDIVGFLADAAATEHNRITVNNVNGAVNFTRGGTAIGTSAAGVVAAGNWYYVEVAATLHDTLGTYEVKFDGTTVIGPTTGADTKNAGTAAVYDTIRLPGPATGLTGTFDDFYLRNDLLFESVHTIPRFRVPPQRRVRGRRR